VELIRRHADRLAWWVSEPDRGQADALNKGFARARGELLGWLSSDDTLLPGSLERVVSRFEADPELVLVYGGALFTDERGGRARAVNGRAGRANGVPAIAGVRRAADGSDVRVPRRAARVALPPARLGGGGAARSDARLVLRLRALRRHGRDRESGAAGGAAGD